MYCQECFGGKSKMGDDQGKRKGSMFMYMKGRYLLEDFFWVLVGGGGCWGVES